MGIGIWKEAYCDECDEIVFDLAGAGEWTNEAIRRELRKHGHKVKGNQITCSDCLSKRDEETKASETTEADPRDIKIIIEIDGGVLTAVHSNNKDIKVSLLDRDNQRECIEDEEKKGYETLEEEIKNLENIY